MTRTYPEYVPARKLLAQYVRDFSEWPAELSGILALANLRPGEQFVLHQRTHRVLRTSDKTIMFDVDGTRRTYRARFNAAFEQLLRDVDGLLLAAVHGVDAGDLVPALCRDPAVDPGFWPRIRAFHVIGRALPTA